ncbi:hypothetical protein [Paraburkholderia sp. GAS42]|jgi:hypothetical protein|uniref:hypothetical protein n=1 Tax=Paraburkholderia sp. GAS42 TaxID=3035135 RepID=UPI003D1E55DA
MATDTDFTANESGSAAFHTSGTYNRGVDVEGTDIGVRGFCGNDGTGVIGASLKLPGEEVSGVLGAKGTGVFGQGLHKGVYGQITSVTTPKPGESDEPDDAGVVGKGYGNNVGVAGLCFLTSLFDTNATGQLGGAAGVLGASNAVSDPDPKHDPDKPELLGAGVVGLSIETLPVGGGSTVLPHPADRVSGSGTGVWGASGSGTGVYGRSQTGRGGVFKSQPEVGEAKGIAQVRLVPWQANKTLLPPAKGEQGDLYVGVIQGTNLMAMYLCISKGTDDDNPAFWQQFQLGDLIRGVPDSER